MKKRLVEITWIDIETRAGWQDEKQPKLKPIKTYGLLKKRGNPVEIASGFDPSNKKWSDVMLFPRGCILNIRLIEQVDV